MNGGLLRRSRAVGLAVFASVGVPALVTSSTASPGEPPAVRLVEIAHTDAPLDLAWRANDTTLFVVNQGGTIVPVRDGAVGAAVLDIRSLTAAEGERGLLGLAFSPDGTTGYVDYTDTDGNTVVAAYPVAVDGRFDAGAGVVLFRQAQPYPNHNGGSLFVDAVGRLYIGLGDGGSGGDPERRALDRGTMLGKIVRLDPKSATPGAMPTPTIWASGVRNPWRTNIDPATGDVWIADVGQNTWEEVDFVPAAAVEQGGLNFGWSAFEGTHPFNADQRAEGATPPVYEYQHGDAGCSISGGAVYRGTAIPALTGRYLFSDYCSGRLRALDQSTTPATAQLLDSAAQVGAVRAGPDGEVYVLSLGGSVFKLVPAA